MTFSELRNMEEEAKLIDKHQRIGIEAERKRILGIIEKKIKWFEMTSGKELTTQMIIRILEEIKKAIEGMK